MEVRFVFKSSSGPPRVRVRRLPLVVGRSEADDVKLRLPHDAVSRRHCEFVVDEAGRVCVRDLDSTNFTFVDGRKLEPGAATPLESGARIKVGNVGFQVEYGPDATAASRDSDTLPMAPPEDQARPDEFVLEPDAEAAGPVGEDAWPVSDEPPIADKNLDDFFKGLS